MTTMVAPDGASGMRIAIIHDWLVTWAGAEKVLGVLLKQFPQAELFTLVNFLDAESFQDAERESILAGRTIHTSFIQRLPGARKHYRRYLPLMPLAVEQFDLKGFDVVLSSSHAVAKGVIPDPEALHICYCYTPMRYAWDMQHQYLRETGHARSLTGAVMRWQLHKLRQWDYLSAQRVDHFIAISDYIRQRVQRCYRRDASVIYPPVEVARFRHERQRDNFYLSAGRLVPYKRFDLVIEAFRHHPDKQLVIIGDGPERKRLERLAGPNVTLMGYQSDSVLTDHLERARAFLYMAEEDFGILPVEAQAAGAPVIGYGKGGLAETVVNGTTGLLLNQQSASALAEAITGFEARQELDSNAFNAASCRDNAMRFDHGRFEHELQEQLSEYLAQRLAS